MRVKLLLALTLCGCASNKLLRASDYQASRVQLQKNQPQLALSDFPNKQELGGFLTTVETGYLNLLGGTPKPKPLVKISDELEKREVISISSELGHFFYQEAEDGYLPAEHEVIWLHLIAGLSFAAEHKTEPARVEAQRAAQLLQGHYNERTGDFDDPGLRFVLAGLWIYCNEWEHARVDLRRAAEMDDRYSWAKKLAENSSPPRNLQIIFAGTGPEPEWQPNSAKAALTGLESLKFRINPTFEKVTLLDQHGEPQILTAPLSSSLWYVRHQQRNYEIRDAVSGSRYLAKAAGQGAYTSTGMALSKISAGTMMAAGLAVATAVVVGAFKLISLAGEGANNDAAVYLASFGVGFGLYTYEEAKKYDRRNMKALHQDWDETMNPAPGYRYMRFLPDQIFASHFSDANLRLQRTNGLAQAPFLTLDSANHKSIVHFYFAN